MPASSVLPVVRVLLVRFCVSVVPTIAPAGAVTVVKAEVPLPITTPLKVVAPVPPLATGSAVPDKDIAKVPEVEMLEGETDKNAGTVIPTEVTEPFPVPAPIALRKVAASKVETVLSALKRGKVTALGLVRVNKLPPTVVAPRLVRASPAVVALVPPLAIGSAVPDRVTAKVPDVVMLAGVTDRNAGTVIPTEVTVPLPPPPVALRVPPVNDKPLPIVISSMAPVAAVVRPKMRAVDMVIPLEVTAPKAAALRLDRASEALIAPVPPLATDNAVPDQFELLIEDRVASEPSPRLVRAPAASVALVPPLARGSVPDT